MSKRNWKDHGACSGMNCELFFPVGSTGPAAEQIERAKAVCQSCPVATQCLDWAMDTHQPAGIWGGLIEDERRTLRRTRNRKRRSQ